jgi:AbrB family looped-hinge helix DNA binding protein
METKLSTKGQVVLPGPIRRELGLQPGDSLDARVQAGRVMKALAIGKNPH